MPVNNVDFKDFISVTDASREVSRLVSEASEGRTFVVTKNGTPAVAIVNVETMGRLSRMEDLEEDLRLLSVALVRTITDSGERHDIDDIAREFGVDLSED